MFLLKNNKKNIDLSINDHSINPFIASNLSPKFFFLKIYIVGQVDTFSIKF